MKPSVLVGSAFAAALLFGGASAAHASPYIVTLEEVGGNVVATGSGAIDLTGLTFFSNPPVPSDSSLHPILNGVITGANNVNVTLYIGTLIGPVNFGNGGVTAAASGSGDLAGMSGPFIIVPLDYISDTTLLDSATYSGATFASLGATPGTYKWTWGTGADQSFTLEIGQTPLPAALPLFATGLGALGLLG